MKNHYFLALGACALSLSLLPAAARGEGPPSPSEKHPDPKHGRPDGKPGEPGKPDGRPGHGRPDDEAKSDKGPKGEHGAPGTDDDKSDRHGHDGFRNAMRQLREDLKSGKLKKGDLKDKLAKLHETAGERGKEHRQELSRRWGNALGQPSAREELKLHARRMAFLDRAMVLAETEAKDKDKVTDRISKLIDKENERHERVMERLKSMPTPPAPSAAASAPAPAPAPAAADSAQGAAK
jgi:hypothetical protein